MAATNSSMALRIALGSAALVGALLLSACSLNDSSPSPNSTPAPSAAPTTTALGPQTPCPPAPYSITTTLGAGKAAVLTFQPTFLLLCRYDGLASSSLLSAKGAVTSASEIASIRSEVNALVSLPSDAIYHCPNDTGGTLDAFFSNSSKRLLVQLRLSGCTFASTPNGSYQVPAGSTLLTQLVALTN